MLNLMTQTKSLTVHTRYISTTRRPCTTSRLAPCPAWTTAVPSKCNRASTSTSQSKYSDAVSSNAAATSATETKWVEVLLSITTQYGLLLVATLFVKLFGLSKSLQLGWQMSLSCRTWSSYIQYLTYELYREGVCHFQVCTLYKVATANQKNTVLSSNIATVTSCIICFVLQKI